MRPTLSLIRREFSAYFYSPIAYVVLAVFLAVTGHLFYLTLEQLTESGPRGIVYPMEIMVGNVAFWLIYLFIPPLLTMRLFAEERSTGTLEMLLTAPVRDWQVVLAKYIACFGFYALMWLPTLLYLPILADWHPKLVTCDYSSVPLVTTYVTLASIAAFVVFIGLCLMVLALAQGRWLAALLMFVFAGLLAAASGWLLYPTYADGKWWVIECGIDPWPIATTYLGLALAGAMFLSIGLFISSLVNSQMIAALVSLFIGLLFIAGYWLPEMDTNELRYQITFFFSVPLHFDRQFSRGQVDTRPLILYSSVAVFGLFLTIRSLESRRWR
jgi:ABC-2 type transport system permease protein